MKKYTLSIVTIFIAVLALISLDAIPYRKPEDVIEWGTVWSTFYIGVMACFLAGYHLLARVSKSQTSRRFAIISIVIVWQTMPVISYVTALVVNAIGNIFGMYLFYGDAGIGLLLFCGIAYLVDGVIGVGFISRILYFKNHPGSEEDGTVV